jgi:LytS/YehU family sensor histidine kinase
MQHAVSAAHYEREKQFTQLQLKTIKNQMDPHFTFNAITSLGTLIYTAQKEQAYDYLVKFSDLIRKTLESSDKVTRTLQEELDFIRQYLDLQKYRYKDHFEYQIKVAPSVNVLDPIPRMLIETHVENALKHGLVHSDKKGLIEINISREGRTLKIEITDNGIGREKAKEYARNSTKIGLKVSEQFYTLINKYNKEKITREIIDLYDADGNPAGTKVIIRIPEGMEYGF